MTQRAAVQSPWRVAILTLFPEFFDSPLATSLLGRAIERGEMAVDRVNPRDFASGKHRAVDDAPYGGGPGMVLKPEPMVAAIEAARALLPDAPVVMLTPQGERLTAPGVVRLGRRPALILVCGRYEGFDERIRASVDLEVSIGDYVLTGGEPAALVLLDAVSRCQSGVLGNDASAVEESFSDGLLEYPQYTRPVEYRGMRVPDVLLSGNHARIAGWRREQALARTQARRPDLLHEELAVDTDERDNITGRNQPE